MKMKRLCLDFLCIHKHHTLRIFVPLEKFCPSFVCPCELSKQAIRSKDTVGFAPCHKIPRTMIYYNGQLKCFTARDKVHSAINMPTKQRRTSVGYNVFFVGPNNPTTPPRIVYRLALDSVRPLVQTHRICLSVAYLHNPADESPVSTYT